MYNNILYVTISHKNINLPLKVIHIDLLSCQLPDCGVRINSEITNLKG